MNEDRQVSTLVHTSESHVWCVNLESTWLHSHHLAKETEVVGQLGAPRIPCTTDEPEKGAGWGGGS